jgi:hypothetical protein
VPLRQRLELQILQIAHKVARDLKDFAIDYRDLRRLKAFSEYAEVDPQTLDFKLSGHLVVLIHLDLVLLLFQLIYNFRHRSLLGIYQ